MAAPKFAPVTPLDRARGYESPDHVPDAWRADRPAEVHGRQPSGPRLGYQGPDQGYAITLAERVRGGDPLPAGRVRRRRAVRVHGDRLRRASLYGRAPVMPTCASRSRSGASSTPPRRPSSSTIRRREFEGVANSLHHYEERRALVDSVPEATLRQTPDQVRARLPRRLARTCSAADRLADAASRT